MAWTLSGSHNAGGACWDVCNWCGWFHQAEVQGAAPDEGQATTEGSPGVLPMQLNSTTQELTRCRSRDPCTPLICTHTDLRQIA